MLNADALIDYSLNGRVRERQGNRHETMAPHNCYRCRGDDNWISIAVSTDAEWRALCGVVGRPELATDERFATAVARWKHQDDLDLLVADWAKDRSDYDAMQQLQAAGIAATPSLSNKALFEDPHLKERGLFQQVAHPALGSDWVIGAPWRLSETPGGVRSRSPLLGEHNHLVLGELGFSDDEISRFEAEQIVY